MKLDWAVRARELLDAALSIGELAVAQYREQGLPEEWGPLFSKKTTRTGAAAMVPLRTLPAQHAWRC